MGDVKRYTAWEIQQDQGGWKPVLEATDEFVRYDDYAALRARLEAAEAALATARRDAAAIARSFSCCHVPDEIAALIAQEQGKGAEG